MRASLAITRVTLRHLLGGRRLLGFGALAVIPAAVTWLSTARVTDAAVVGRFHEVTISLVFLIVMPVVALVLGSGSLGDERRDGTLSFLVLRPLPRWTIAAAKLVAAWLATTLIAGSAAAAAAVAAGLRSGEWSLLAPVVLAVTVSSLAYAAVFLVIGYLTSRAVLIGLVYVFIWENGITFAAASLANVSLFRIGLSAYVALVPESAGVLDEMLGAVAPGALGAAAKATVVAVMAVIGVAAILRRRDLL